MFYNYTSYNLQNLAHTFLEKLQANKASHPFSAHWIILQNREMQQWLTIQEATQNSISANNDFIFPQEFLWKLYRLKNPSIPKAFPSDRISMQWSIHQCFINDKNLLKQVLGTSEIEEKQLLQLAKTIADVFDLYQVYRPYLISAWERGESLYATKYEQWQASLWMRLKELWNSDNTNHFGRVDAFQELLSWLEEGDFPFNKLPKHIWIFSVPQWSKPFTDIVTLLSKFIDVHNFTMPILQESNDEDVATFNRKLLEALLNNKEVLNQSASNFSIDIEEIPLVEEPFSTSTLLHKIKALLRNQSIDINESEDSSFSVHSCHSVKREVEVLKDELLSAFNNDKTLKPEECLILVPKLDEYQLQIEKTFSSEVDEVNIPVATKFRNSRTFRNNTLLELLSLINSEFRVNDVLNLLENEIIAKQFDISNDEFVLLTEWCAQLHIHRTFNESSFSWVNAIDKMFLGFAMQSDPYQTYKNKVSFDKILNSDSADLLAKLSQVIHKLYSSHLELNQNSTLLTWLQKLEDIVQKYFYLNYNDDYQLQDLYKTLDKLKEQIVLSKNTEKISADTFVLWLKDRLDSKESTTTGFGHGVQITDYVPNRNISAKFVAILGLNENVLPYPVIRPEFDIIHKNPTVGDRIEKHEQLYLFYDLIQAADQQLHISYTGQSEYSEIGMLPSILLQQLLDTLESVGLKIEINKHPLHGFNPNNFDANSPKSFSKRKRDIANAIRKNSPTIESLIEDNYTFDELFSTDLMSVSDLKSFVVDPAKFICSNILGISNYTAYEEIDDRDFFNISGLDKYSLKVFLTEVYLKNKDVENIEELMHAANFIPEGYFGILQLNELKQLISKVKEISKVYDFTSKKSLEVNIKIDEFEILGTIPDLYQANRLKIYPSKIKPKHIAEMWLYHILLNIEGSFDSKMWNIDTSIKDIEIRRDQIEAKESLLNVLKMMQSALKNPNQAFYPLATCYEFAKDWNKNRDLDSAIQRAKKQWDSNSEHSYNDDVKNYYNKLLFKDESFIETKEFQNWALEFWMPILNTLEV